MIQDSKAGARDLEPAPGGAGCEKTWGCEAIMPNEANSATIGWPPGANRAERTQFAGAVSGPAWTECAKQTQFGGGGPIALNEPNLPCNDRKTAPADGGPGLLGAVNRAKQTQSAGGLLERQVLCRKGVREDVVGESPRRNKANLVRPGWRLGANRAKRTQFAGAGSGFQVGRLRRTNPIWSIWQL